MNSPSSWYLQQERGSKLGMRFIVWAALSLGRQFICLLLIPIVLYYCIFFRAAKVSSKDFLRRVLLKEPGFWQVFRHFYSFALVTTDRLYFLADRWQFFDIRVHAEADFSTSISTSKGCLLLMSHVGSFDVVRAVGRSKRGLRAKVLMDRNYAQKVMGLINELNPELAEDIVDVEQPPATLMLCLQNILANGEVLGVMADRVHKSDRTLLVNFLDEKIGLPAGPWHMALALKVPVVACFGVYSGVMPDRHGKRKPRYDIYFKKLYDGAPVSRAERQQWVQVAAQSYADALQERVKEQPFNWFNFFNIWVSEKIENH